MFYFTLLFEVLFTFPSRYWFTIGLWGVFSLTGWSRQIHTGFLVSRATQDTAINLKKYLYGTITLYGTNFHYVSNSFLDQISQSYNPNYALLHNWFGLLRVRSPLLAESLLFSSLSSFIFILFLKDFPKKNIRVEREELPYRR